ncbi:ABC transporter ATP-binding protein [Sphingomonas montana]|uniref:ABC transporter ATP-binding protein n=1 Tax=Sphingomonas montana TaxID=1843236 RepID=UPI00096DCEC4|nr:ABC transporter ATP-binding protein [Sphingomonas montana]
MVTIAMTDLSVRLAGRTVLDGVTATVPPGALVGVVGPNGAGKSTLARAVAGLLPPSAGSVRIDGRDVGAVPAGDRARTIAYLPQGQILEWPLSVARLVALGRLPYLTAAARIAPADAQAIERALATADVADLRDRVATELSGGERARVLLARALAVEAPVLIVDEPLAALDPGHQLHVMAMLEGLARGGATVLVVLHDLGMAQRFCARLLMLDAGRLVADGPPEMVLTAERLAAVYGVRAWVGVVDGRRTVVPVARI